MTTSEATFVPRTIYIEEICNIVVDQTYVAAIEHFAVPMICGMSLDDISVEEWNEQYHGLPKPPPLKEKHKVTIYDRIKEYFKPVLLSKISKVAKCEVLRSTNSLSYVQVHALAAKLKEITKFKERDWTRIQALFEDHICLFRELKAKIGLDIEASVLHDIVCPIMEHERDVNGLMEKISLDAILKQNDRGM